MKIYVSEKEIIENDLLDAERYDIVLTKYREDFWEEEIYPEIQSLEQHEAEIKKPLEDEIVKLNEFISRLISEKEPETAREITERHHREIMLERKNKFLEEEIEYLNKQQKPIKHDSFLLSKIDRLEDKVIDLQQQLKEMKGE